jgi:phenylacetate-CoA ligase
MEIEPKLNTPEMREIQENKLKRRIKLLREKAPYYTELFKVHGVHEEKIKSFEEFRRTIPIFTKNDWRKLLQDHEGNFLEALDQIVPFNAYEDLYLLATTSGTTGEPSPYPFTREDAWDIYGEILARYAWRAGVRRSDRVLHCFGLSMVIAGIPSIIGSLKVGSAVIPVGAEAGTERILRTAKWFRPTVLRGTPSLALYLIEKAPEVIGMKIGELGIRVIICGGEPGAGVPEVRQRIESAFGCRLFDVGAAPGISCAHEEYQGMHFVADDFVIFELVDPNTKQPLLLENGQRGEAVFTFIEGGGWGWVRHSMGDIMEIYTEPCPCGLSGFRYKVVGRTDDMLKVKGVMIYPAMIKNVIESFVPRVTGQFRIILNEAPPRVVPPLELKLEHGETILAEELDELGEKIANDMSSKIKVRPRIIWVRPQELKRSTYKGQIFEKSYEKK